MKTCSTCKYFNVVGYDPSSCKDNILESLCMYFLQERIIVPEWVARAAKTTSNDGTVCDAHNYKD